jgi:CRP/FNR family transcriptional regulator, cyclic AMP receptor protein
MASLPISGRARRRDRKTACVTFPAGIYVFDRQHPSRQVYWLRSGRVQLSSGREAILDHLTRGDWFGEKLLLTSRRIDLVAKTLSPVKVIAFRKSELWEQLRRDRRLARQVLKNLALRVDRYEEAIRNFITEPAERRLAHALVRLLPSRPASGWVRLPSNFTNPELARIVGTTRWHISHFVNRFQQLGWLRRQEGLWVQREGLQAFLHSTTPPEW